MKKSVSFTFLTSLCLISAELDMPPMIPMLDTKAKIAPQTTPKTSQQKIPSKAQIPQTKECEAIPPMLFMLPPPLQGELDKCINSLKKPTLETVQAMLIKRENLPLNFLTEIKIESAKEFTRVYEISYKSKNNLKTLLCNEMLSRCIAIH